MSHAKPCLLPLLTALVIVLASSAGVSSQQASEAPRAANKAAGTAADRVGVQRAALDYIEGFYEGDTLKITRSIRPEIAKYGFDLPKDSTRYVGEAMSWTEILSYTRSVKARKRPVNPAWPKTVELLDVQDQTAAAKVTAWWGTDYLLLAKYDGRWMITHILWQSLPRS